MKLLSFGNLPWDDMWKRHQSLVWELGNDRDIDGVVYINPQLWLKDHLLKSITGNEFTNALTTIINNKNRFGCVDILTPIHAFPGSRVFSCLRRLEDKILYNTILKLLDGHEFISIVNNPFVYESAVFKDIISRSCFKIFDMSDDFTEFYSGNSKQYAFKNMTNVICESDLVLAVNNHLKDKYIFANNNIHVINNATNFFGLNKSAFNAVKSLDVIKSKYKKIIGYSGWFNEVRVDANIFDAIIDLDDYAFIVVGPASSAVIEKFRRDNVFFLPPVPYMELFDYINYFDVCIIPFLINDHTKGNDLLKIHDYHSLGKPVVSTDIGGVERFSELIYIANTKEAFKENIVRAFSEDSETKKSIRQDSALQNSWKWRTKDIKSLINTNYYYRYSENVFNW